MDSEEHLFAGLKALGIEVEDKDREGLLLAWAGLAAMAHRVMECPLPDDAEPAPQFLP